MSDLPEFSRKVDLREITEKPVRLSATPQECAALARRFAISLHRAAQSASVVAASRNARNTGAMRCWMAVMAWASPTR